MGSSGITSHWTGRLGRGSAFLETNSVEQSECGRNSSSSSASWHDRSTGVCFDLARLSENHPHRDTPPPAPSLGSEPTTHSHFAPRSCPCRSSTAREDDPVRRHQRNRTRVHLISGQRQ